MTGLLFSVKNLEEASVALNSATDIIDLKDPHSGALGGLPISDIAKINGLVAGRKIVSATVGDLPMEPDVLVEQVKKVALTGVDIVKVGFFGNQRHTDCIEALQVLTSQGVRIVAVMIADQQPDFSRIKTMSDAGFYGVMLDTANKTTGSLLDYLLVTELEHFVIKCRATGIKSGLAGSLKIEHIEQLANLNPDYLGFRGAICFKALRAESICADKMQEIGLLLHKCNNKPCECTLQG